MKADHESPVPPPGEASNIESSDSASLLRVGGDSFWKRSGVYVLGAFLIYTGIICSFTVGYSSNPKMRFWIGIIIGPLIATLPAGIHFVLQWAARKISQKIFEWSSCKEAMILNLPALVLMMIAVGQAYYATSAKPVFERFVSKPIPSSVRIIEHGGGQINISEGTRVGIHFQIEPEELQNLLQTGGFKLVEDDSGVDRWKYAFSHYAQIDMAFTMPYALYFRVVSLPANSPFISQAIQKTNAPLKVSELSYENGDFLFCSTNGREVYYLRLAH